MKISLFALSDFFKVQGATEPYYVWQYLFQRHKVIAFLPGQDRKRAETGVYRVWRLKGLPTFVSYNLFVLPRLFCRECLRTQIVYTYKGIVTPVLLLVFLFGKRWVCDFQTSPLNQEIEFRKLKGSLSPFRRLAYRLGRLFYRLTLRRCDLVVAISEEVKQELIEEYGVPEEKVHLQPLGVDLDLFSPQEEPPDPKKGLRLVYIGAIARQRGLDTVIQALALLKEQGIPAELVIVGQGMQDDIRRLQDLAKDKDVAERVLWQGYVPHRRIPRILETCHIALSPLPPLRAYEVSSPAKVFEYLAMKKVVIATDILAHRKIIRHGENGLLVPPGDPEALAQAIASVYHDEALRRRLAENARESVKPYEWKQMLGVLERRLRELVR